MDLAEGMGTSDRIERVTKDDVKGGSEMIQLSFGCEGQTPLKEASIHFEERQLIPKVWWMFGSVFALLLGLW